MTPKTRTVESASGEREAAVGRDLRTLAATPLPGFRLSVLERVGIVDDYAPADTVVGPVFVAFNRRGVSRLARAETTDEFEEIAVRELGRPVRRSSLPVAVGRALERGSGAELDYDLRGVPPFWGDALRVLLSIPRGQVRSYSWVAATAGRPRAVRAAGSACAGNPVPLLIPCHRVVRQDGHIGAYGLGGPATKRRLLGHEGLDPDALERLASHGVRLLGDPEAGVVHVPTCEDARRLWDGERIELHDLEQARTAGLRPCERCRPV